MFKMIYHLIFKPIKPFVGMKLECVDWGRDYTEVEIVRVSKNKKAILYKFNKCKGGVNTSNDTYSGDWPYILDTYSLIEE